MNIGYGQMHQHNGGDNSVTPAAESQPSIANSSYSGGTANAEYGGGSGSTSYKQQLYQQQQQQQQYINYTTSNLNNERPRKTDFSDWTMNSPVSVNSSSGFAPFNNSTTNSTSHWTTRSKSFSNHVASPSLTTAFNARLMPPPQPPLPQRTGNGISSLGERIQNFNGFDNMDSIQTELQNLNVGNFSGVPATNTGTKLPVTDAVSQLRFEIKLRDEIIETFKLDNAKLRSSLDSAKRAEELKPADVKEIPINHFQLFEALSKRLEKAEKKAEESESHLESVLTAVSMSPTQSVTDFGRYDPQDLAHKIIVKMKLLQEQNDEMLKLLSYGRSKQKDIELQLLRAKVLELECRLKVDENEEIEE